MRKDGFALTPAEMEAVLAEQGGAQPGVTVEPEGEGSFILVEEG